jgi:hypothetical protein
MATYYKYAERAAGSQVNWAEIGKNLTDTLSEENKLREQKKAAIDEATRQYGLQLEKSPQGDFKSFNQWGLDYAADAQEARLLQDRLLKSGKLKLRDYTMMRQNLTDGTNQAFGLLDEYNAEYKQKMERAKSMDPANRSQYLEQWLMAKGEMFANLKDSKLYINPTTFAVNVAKIKRENGVESMSNDPNDFTTINELRNYVKAKYDYFDSDTYLTKQVGMLGTEIKTSIISGTSTKVGQKITIEDITTKGGAREAISAMINTAFAGMPTNISSVLTNDLGKDADGNNFDFTFNKDEKGKIVGGTTVNGKVTGGKNLIYFDEDGNPQFTPEQEKAAKDYMLQKMSVMLTRKEDIDVYTEPRPASTTSAGNKSREDYYKDMAKGNLLAYFYSGNGTEIEAARQGIKALPGVNDVIRTKDGVLIKFEDDNGNITERPFSFYDNNGNLMSIGNFVASMGQGIYGEDVSLEAISEGAYNIGNTNLNNQYMSGPDLRGLDPTNWRDAIEIQNRISAWKEDKKNQPPPAPPNGNGGSGNSGGNAR